MKDPILPIKKIAEFKFKGSRKYVHGTDIIDLVVNLAKDRLGNYPDAIKGSFHRRLESQGMIRIFPQDHKSHANTYHSVFSIEVKNKTYLVTLNEIDQPITSAYAYDEEAVTSGITYADKTVQNTVNHKYSFIEQLVALTKKLHLRTYTNRAGNWYFTKIQIRPWMAPDRFPDHHVKVEAKKNFHNKLTQNFIYLDNEFIGDIWFSLLPEGQAK